MIEFDTSNMYRLTILNMTTAAIEKSDTMFRTALILEWALLTVGFFETMMLWYLLRFTTQYHRNLSCIVEQLANQYFISIVVRIYMIYMQLTITNTAELVNNNHFLFAVWLRNSLLFVAFYFSPFPVFERVFATIYMQDYETKKRRWVSYSLSAILYIHAFSSAQFFMFAPYRELHIFLITAFNFLAFGLTFILEWYNKRKYKYYRTGKDTVYSLSARAQLSENIKSTMPFKVMCFSIAFFASFCTSMLHVDDYTENQTIRNWVYIAFNFSCWSFGAVVPFIMLAYNPQWQKELKRLAHKFCFSKRIQPHHYAERQAVPTSKVRDSFGNNCFVNDRQHSNVYFSQLNAEWNGLPERSTSTNHNKRKKKQTLSVGWRAGINERGSISVNSVATCSDV